MFLPFVELNKTRFRQQTFRQFASMRALPEQALRLILMSANLLAAFGRLEPPYNPGFPITSQHSTLI